MALPEITVLQSRSVPSPESESADRGLPADAVASVPFEFAFTESWPTDAHCTQYECITINGVDIRLASGALDEFPVKMVWLIGDLDAPFHHAFPEWRAKIEPILESTGFAWYSTKGGYRIVARLKDPVILRRGDAHVWKDKYLTWCDEIKERFGLELDRRANDWTRLFRLPSVVRDGVPVVNPLHGTPPVVPTPNQVRLQFPPPKVKPAPQPEDLYPFDLHDGDSAFDQAIALAQRMPPSIEGAGGDQALFTCANELAQLLNDAEEIEAVLSAVFNQRCEPPWPESKLRREARVAAERVARLGGVREWAKRKQAQAQAEAETGDNDEPIPAFDLPLVTDMKGRPLPTLDNALIALESWFGGDLWSNELNGRLHCDRAEEMIDCPNGAWRDIHTTALHAALQRTGIRLARQDVRHAIDLYGNRNARNPLSETLAELAEKWDGTARVDEALAKYWGCADTPAVRAASRVTMLSLAARGMAPGAKVDTCLVLVGEQGAGKSTSLRALALRDEWFGDSDLPLGDKDARQLLRGKWIWEMQELASLARREAEQVKAFISQTYDTFRGAYRENAEDVQRTCLLFGTANRTDILQDPTGHRRFLPVHTGAIDTAGLQRDRDQILGEAAARVLLGEQHWPTDAEKILLRKSASDFEETDPWEDTLRRWIDAKPDRAGEGFTPSEIFSLSGGAIPLEESRQTQREVRRLAGALQRLGFTRKRVRRKGRREYCWLPSGAAGSTIPDAPAPRTSPLN